MVNEILDEVKRISNGKKIKNALTILYVYLVRVLIAFIPATVITIINFIIKTFFELFDARFLNSMTEFIFSIITLVISVGTFVLTSPFLFGCLNYFLNEAKENNANDKLTKYLTNKNLWKKQMYMTLYLLVGTTIGLICFIIPGVFFFSKRVMAPFILIDHEELTVKECFKMSKEVMQNRYKDLIRICIRMAIPTAILYILIEYLTHFSPWTRFLGNVLLVGVAFVFLIAISDMILAFAALYMKINGKKAGAIDVEYREIDD